MVSPSLPGVIGLANIGFITQPADNEINNHLIPASDVLGDLESSVWHAGASYCGAKMGLFADFTLTVQGREETIGLWWDAGGEWVLQENC